MRYAEANRRVSNWLASLGIEMESGKILDSRGCCFTLNLIPKAFEI